MKKLFNVLGVIVFLAYVCAGCRGTTYIAQTPVDQPLTYQTFYDNLSPYGIWLDYPGYGNVWNPHAGNDFRPYATNGQWRYTNDGWAWESNYNWGWAPFHYGRWLYDDNYGWLWVPGYEWSPAWVTWGSVDDYYAWAPLTPEVDINVQYNNWRPHNIYWNMVPREHVADRNLSNVMIRNNQYNNITIINNYNTSRSNNYHAKGPDVHEVERYTHNMFDPVQFKDVNRKPVQRTEAMEVYRPAVQKPREQNESRNNQHYNPGNPSKGNNPAPTNQQNPVNNSGSNITHDQNNQPRKGEQMHGNTNPNPPVNTNNNPALPPPQHPQNLPAPNTIPVRNTPAFQNSSEPNRPQPRKFRTVDPAQIKPIREDNQVPVNQPAQQRRNVKSLPEQKRPQNNNNNQGQHRSDGHN